MPQPASHRILLAEEQAVSRDLVMLVLGKLGYRIDTVTTARELLERVGSCPWSLILLSATLARRAGAELLDAIRADPGNRALPIAMIGGESGAPSGVAWLEAGVIDHLSRPIDIESLLRVVERAARGRPSAARAGITTEPVIDVRHLRGFTDGDLQLEGELLALFLSSTEVYLDRMRDALGTGQSWSATAHALKGASANLGARRVWVQAVAAERAPPSPTQLEALRAAVDEVRAFSRAQAG